MSFCRSLGSGKGAFSAAPWSWPANHFGTLSHACIQSRTITLANVGEMSCLLRLNAVTAPFHDSAEKHLFNCALPRQPFPYRPRSNLVKMRNMGIAGFQKRGRLFSLMFVDG